MPTVCFFVSLTFFSSAPKLRKMTIFIDVFQSLLLSMAVVVVVVVAVAVAVAVAVGYCTVPLYLRT